jgi:phosphatidylserine decarboxylase
VILIKVSNLPVSNRRDRAAVHQYVDRMSGEVCSETLLYDRQVAWMYSTLRESAPWLVRWITHSPKLNELLAKINFDHPMKGADSQIKALVTKANIRMDELLDPLPEHPTWRDFFCRKIKFWESRPMDSDLRRIVAPCDSRVLLGHLSEQSRLPIKNKLFSLPELLGGREPWVKRFAEGDWAIFRLTPEMYHYNHCPVSGTVQEFYEVGGAFHSCNPSVCVEEITPYSKNRRFVTIIDTDTPGGTGIGKVAMVEVVALLIGRVHQCYSRSQYRIPTAMFEGLVLKRGSAKSVFEPGSSTVVLLFENDRVEFDPDLIENQGRADVQSRFSVGFGTPAVETQVQVRSGIANAKRLVIAPKNPLPTNSRSLYELSA